MSVWVTAILLGLLGSLHCIGMCGPIAMVLPVDHSSKTKKIFQSFLYQIGRVGTYGIIGFVFGLVGRGLFLSGFQQRLSILAGCIMILSIIIPHKYLSKLKLTGSLYMFLGSVKQKMGRYLGKKNNKAVFMIGVLNGLLPCGLIYMALIGALALGTPLKGMQYMILFGLGTIPLMTGAFLLGNFIKS